ncbi:MAG TPA: hypothetical protein VFR70_00905 [Flavobacterium sp.]|nr:hypothetical protein [Flavobacterium sp.]
MGAQGQRLRLFVRADAEGDQKKIDSVAYRKDHADAKSVFGEASLLSEKLQRMGYLENEILENRKINDTTFLFRFYLGKMTKAVHIYIGRDSALQNMGILDASKEVLVLPFSETEQFLNDALKRLEKKGYPLAKLRLADIKNADGVMSAVLDFKAEKRREVDGIVINGYDKFPEGHKREIWRRYRNKVLSQETLKKIHDDFDRFQFVSQVKYPEILFKTDTTKVYVYLEKSKPNRFDGFVGFGNSESGSVKINGYLDLLLVNFINAGERFNLYWKSDGNRQTTFNATLELPYMFKSPLGLKTSLNIFKQDSTFQKTQTVVDLGYYFNYNTRLYFGYQSAESNDIQNLAGSAIKDYSNSFVTSSFEFTQFRNDDLLFPERTGINIKGGVGKRESGSSENRQFFISADLRHAFYLNAKNSINIRSQNFYLQSGDYLANELFRFGGINSIRGFNENSLQANVFSSILTEYRYVLAPAIYIHTIADFGYYQDKTAENEGNLLGIGLGFGLLTKNGLFKIVYANGSAGEQQIKFSNSVMHLSFQTKF